MDNTKLTSRAWLTLPEVLAEIQVARSTFDLWRGTGRGPRAKRLPNGELRISRRTLDEWWERLAE